MFGYKCLPAVQETWVRILGREDPLEKEMATHSSTLVWKIPWTEEPGRLQSMGSQRVGHDWATSFHFRVWKIWPLFPFLSPPSFSLAVPHNMWGHNCPVRDWTCFPSDGSMEWVLTSGLAGKVLLFIFFSFLPYSPFSFLIFSFLFYQKRLFIS